MPPARVPGLLSTLTDPSRYLWIGSEIQARRNRPVDAVTFHARRAALRSGGIRGKRVLVAGCNRGQDCRPFVEMGAARVDGIDVIDDVGADYEHPAVHYRRASIEDLPFAAEFDLTFSHATLEHVPRIDLAIPELVRVLRPGGTTYDIAGPLWNSAQGHHKGAFFAGHPWLHLRMGREEIVDYARGHAISDPAGIPMEAHVDYMLKPEFFNRTPAATYTSVAASVPGVKLLANRLLPDPSDGLTPELEAELAALGYPREELLANTHVLIARRLRS